MFDTSDLDGPLLHRAPSDLKGMTIDRRDVQLLFKFPRESRRVVYPKKL